MIDERAFELLQSQLAFANEERASLRKQVESLLAEMKALRSSSDKDTEELKDTIRELVDRLSENNRQMENLNQLVSHLNDIINCKDELLANLSRENKNLKNDVKNGRKHLYGRNAEQQCLLNNRDMNILGQDKADYDGTPDSVRHKDEAEAPQQKNPRKKEDKKRAPKKSCKVDKTVVHKVEDYYNLPEGAYYMARDGERNISYYRVIEYIKAQNVEHIYEVARVHLPNGEFENTMDDPMAKLGGIFSPELLAQVLSWKYVYHMSANRIRKMLKNQGVHISKGTLNRYIQNGMSRIRQFLGDVFKREVQSTNYLMVDETTELVGIDQDNGRTYKKKYLWAFFAKLKRMVYYLYDNGSRARRVALDFLKEFSGYISTDGYVAYSIFDDAGKYPDIVHIGCWVHCRRKWIDALPTDRRAIDMINMIADLFRNEITFKTLNLKPFQIEDRRKKRSKPILRKIHDAVVMMATDIPLMANEMMRKAVNYTLNQWKSLENFIGAGLVEISNNLCEQRMKAVKLNLKNCQNIGSEDAAENAAFMFSVTESCTLNDINPENYLTKILTIIKDGKEVDKVQLLPCYYNE